MKELKKKKPSYIELYERVRDDIVKGIYRQGEKLPSKRFMAEKNMRFPNIQCLKSLQPFMK